MREIKFRAWDNWNKKIIYQDANDPWVINGNGKIGYEWVSEGGGGIEWKDDCIIMQYTGLKDKTGKEIYEGDILLENDSGLKYPVECTCLRWNYSKLETILYGFAVSGHIGLVQTLEVIGNIYENPELVEIKK